MNNCCVYTHSKPNGDVFYIGKGNKQRPFMKTGRNKWWGHVVKKHHDYLVTIIEDSLTNEEALELEVLLIAEAREAGWPLCNITDGGEGAFGYKHPESHKQTLYKPVKCIETNEVFKSIKSASETMGLDKSSIAKVAHGKFKQTGGYRFKFVNKEI